MICIPKPGDKLKFTRSIVVPDGHIYSPGDILELIEPTGMAPHGYKSHICNWIVKCNHCPKGSVWSTIWFLLDNGMLTRA